MRKIFLATLAVVMLLTATALAAGWELVYYDNEENQIFFDPDKVTIHSRAGDTAEFSAPFRMVYSDKGRNNLIKWYRENSIMPRDIENLAYDVATIRFKKDGDDRYFYIVERTSYTANGASLSDMHYVNDNPTWQKIDVGSVVDVEYYNAILIVDGKKFDPK